MAGVKGRSGPPSIRCQATYKAICDRLASGEPLAQICRNIGVSDGTVREWQRTEPEFADAIARARLLGFDEIAARLRDVARGGQGSSGDVQRDKLIVETDLKLLAKWDPKRYGELQRLAHEGQDGGPIVVQWIGDQQ